MDWSRYQSAKQKRRAARRMCGECQACCTLLAVRGLGKPSHTPCYHLCKGGCSIYEKRPSGCVNFDCLWLAGLVGDDVRSRPDQLGIMFSFGATDPQVLCVYENRPFAFEQNQAVLDESIRQLSTRFVIKLVLLFPYRTAPMHFGFPVDPRYTDTNQGKDIYRAHPTQPRVMIYHDCVFPGH